MPNSRPARPGSHRGSPPRRRTALGAALLSAPLALTGLAAPAAHAAPTAGGLADVTITQRNVPADGSYAVGSVMSYDITLTNTGTTALSYEPVATNLDGQVLRCK